MEFQDDISNLHTHTHTHTHTHIGQNQYVPTFSKLGHKKRRQIMLSKYKNHAIICPNNKKGTSIEIILLSMVSLNKIRVGNFFEKPR